MKKAFILVTILVLAIPSFAGFKDIYNKKLETDSKHLVSMLKIQDKKNSLDSKQNFFIPSISFGTETLTFTSKGIVQTEKPYNLFMTANFIEALGTKIGVSFPFNADISKNTENWKDISLSVSRPLITEFYLDEPTDRAALLSEEYTLSRHKWEVFAKLVSDIYEYSTTLRIKNLNEQKLQILEKLYNSEQDTTKKSSLNTQIINTKKIIMTSQLGLNNYDFNYTPELMLETQKICNKIYNSMPSDLESIFKTRKDFKAMELSYEIDKTKKNLWFLPYLPNPSITFNLTPMKNFEWSLALNFQYSLLDKGSRSTQAYQRNTQAEISKLNLNDLKETVKSTLKKLNNDLEILKVEKEAKEKELSETKKDLERQEKLFSKNLITKEIYELSKIDYELKNCDYEKYTSDIYITALKITMEYDTEVGGGEL